MNDLVRFDKEANSTRSYVKNLTSKCLNLIKNPHIEAFCLNLFKIQVNVISFFVIN